MRRVKVIKGPIIPLTNIKLPSRSIVSDVSRQKYVSAEFENELKKTLKSESVSYTHLSSDI